MNIIENMLSKYNIETTADALNAERELMQIITLSGLYRGGFFEKAAFYGGTCLRIFYKLERFSEDMDFSLLKKETGFSFAPYFESIIREFEALGIKIEIQKKDKSKETNIESAFLKQSSSIFSINLKNQKKIKIKLEVDTDPPLGFSTENKLILQPYSFFINAFTLPDLFAGKMHALLFRVWKNRVKGRDWFDFEWYVRNDVQLNLSHFAERAYQSKHIPKNSISKEVFLTLLKNKIETVDFKIIKADIRPFVINPKTLDIWSKEYFLELAKMVKV